jgi:hypothetical protein
MAEIIFPACRPVWSSPRKHKAIAGLVMILLMIFGSGFAEIPDSTNGLYIPASKIADRKISEFIHYADLAGLNAAVLHVKDPHGWLSWKSNDPVAVEIGAGRRGGHLPDMLKKLKANGIWTIAKLDVFVDHQLISHRPEWGLLDVRTGNPWTDKNGSYWANPYDQRVWDYNLNLCRELVAMGFDEIQFDYIRFPSDGDLLNIAYPHVLPDLAKSHCISAFLKTAQGVLKPMGVVMSVDLFGLVAWKDDDFGIGQVVEEIAPYVDVLCPMLYPSHFPEGFLGKKNPARYPRQIMELSVKRLEKRTTKIIRPWIQGFWYSPDEINAQLDGVSSAGGVNWSIWNPSGNYATTYSALAARQHTIFPEPQFYPSLSEILKQDPKVIRGNLRVVNLTDYQKGFSILSLEESTKQYRSSYSTPMAMLATLDESIMDRILSQRDIAFKPVTSQRVKRVLLADLMCKDIDIEARRLRPMPIYIDWQSTCRFTRSIPEDRLSTYTKSLEKSAPAEYASAQTKASQPYSYAPYP